MHIEVEYFIIYIGYIAISITVSLALSFSARLMFSLMASNSRSDSYDTNNSLKEIMCRTFLLVAF